jgi:H+/Cl- antiporter ClcA
MILLFTILLLSFIVGLYGYILARLVGDRYVPCYHTYNWQRTLPIPPVRSTLMFPVGTLCKAYCRDRRRREQGKVRMI